MSEYWKSLPKKYCDFCKCWFTDNKASKDFHDRGLRHQANVRKRVKEIQKNNAIQEKERQQYNAEMLKIEAAALGSFQNDIARDPSLSKEMTTSQLNLFQSNITKSAEPPKTSSFNRFGQSFSEESETLVNGKKRALETIAKTFEKKSKWLEAKTAEGSTYYWNKDTLETKYEAPKSGFLNIEEQKQFKNMSSSSNDDFTNLSYQRSHGGWKSVEKKDEHQLVDLQLPSQDVSQIMLDIKQCSTQDKKQETNEKESVIFKERTVGNLTRPLRSDKDKEVSFKKRTNVKRNIRSRDETN